MKNKKFIIFCIDNIKLSKQINHIQLGDFLLFDYRYFKQKFPNLEPPEKEHMEYSIVPNKQSKGGFVLYSTEQNINSNNFKKNFELQFCNFIDFLLYLHGKRAFEENKFNYTQFKENKKLHFICNEINFASYSDVYQVNCMNCIISEQLFKKAGNNKRIFDLIKLINLNKMEKKIKLAIDWIALALKNNHLTQAFMCLCISLETLLTSDSSSPLERGVAYQLREFGAFLASNNQKERLEIQSKIKELYAIRCSITHSGSLNNAVSEKQFYDLLNILKAVIGGLFELIDKKNITDSEKLRLYIDNIKFE